MHVEIHPDLTIELVQNEADNTEERYATEAAAAALVALHYWEAGDYEAANATLVHAVHGDLPPMSLALAFVQISDTTLFIMSPEGPIQVVESESGATIRLEPST